MRGLLVDGPEHGTTKYFEGEPPPELLTAGLLLCYGMQSEEMPASSALKMPIFKYVRGPMSLLQKTVVYFYEGQLQ